MIDLRLGPDEELMRDSARAFARERLLPAMRRHEAQHGVDQDVVRGYRDLGFASMEAPETVGGQGASLVAKCVVLEELGAGDAGATLALEGAGPALHALVELNAASLVRDLVTRADLRIALVDDVDERLALRGDRLTGTHPWAPVPAASCAAVVVLQGERMMLVREGVRYTRVTSCGLEAADASQLDFDAVVPAGAIASGRGVARARASGRFWTAAVLVGVARAATEYAMRYAQERTAFGRPIAHHQGLAFLLVDMATAVEVARLAVWQAAVALDRDEDATRAAAWAFAEAAEQALFVGPAAVQVLGGHGFMKDHPVEKWMRDARTLAQLLGGRDAAELSAAACEDLP